MAQVQRRDQDRSNSRGGSAGWALATGDLASKFPAARPDGGEISVFVDHLRHTVFCAILKATMIRSKIQSGPCNLIPVDG
jgi:hypothetical protein